MNGISRVQCRLARRTSDCTGLASAGRRHAACQKTGSASSSRQPIFGPAAVPTHGWNRLGAYVVCLAIGLLAISFTTRALAQAARQPVDSRFGMDHRSSPTASGSPAATDSQPQGLLDILTGGDSTVTTTEEPAYEDVPPPPLQHDVPVWHQPTDGSIDLNFHEGRISLVVNDAPLNRVLSLIAQKQKLNVVCAENISARISVVLHDVTLDDVLTAVLSTAGYTWVLRHNILHVTSLSEANTVAPDIQGRRMEVFTLDYASGTDVDATIQGLLSPVGQSFLTNATSDDYRKPRDTIVVEDLPAYLARIRDYICQVDQPPRQVLIQVHILEVDLEDDKRHGVNFKHMASIFNNTIELEMKGAANPSTPPHFLPE
jgi:hypothetical protein